VPWPVTLVPMNVVILPCAKRDADRPDAVRILAVLVYQDGVCGFRGKAALDRVMARLPFRGECALDLWPFDLLEYPLLKREAAEGAARSTVIMLSLRGDRLLPAAVKSWIKLWLSQTTRQDQALALLMDESQRQPTTAMETVAYLKCACQRSGVHLFAGFPNTASGAGKAATIRKSAGPVPRFPLPTEAMQQLDGFKHSLAFS
jgi:hypothetical protein